MGSRVPKKGKKKSHLADTSKGTRGKSQTSGHQGLVFSGREAPPKHFSKEKNRRGSTEKSEKQKDYRGEMGGKKRGKTS